MPAPIDPRPQRLARMKAVALACLLAALALLILAESQQRAGAWAWVGAFAEAASIGALADWFAVVALFRHPLRLPIPHTAIIPRNKTRMADALAQFLLKNFLVRESLLARLDAWNPAQKLGQWLAQPEHSAALARQLQRWLRESQGALDAAAIERELLALLRQQLHDWDAARSAASLARNLTAGQHHQRLLNAVLGQLAGWLDTPEVRGYISEKVLQLARREYPRLVWFADRLEYSESLGDALAGKIAHALLDEIRNALDDGEHPLRLRYAAEAERLLTRLEDDAEFRAQVAQWKAQLLEREEVQDYARHLWQRTQQWLQRSLADEDSPLLRQLRGWSEALGQRLQQDPLWQQSANAQFRIAAEHLTDWLRQQLPGYIRQTIEAWDDEKMSREIELAIGRDLQYIRLNGTLIGGLAGLVLHALLLWLRG